MANNQARINPKWDPIWPATKGSLDAIFLLIKPPFIPTFIHNFISFHPILSHSSRTQSKNPFLLSFFTMAEPHHHHLKIVV